MHPSLDAPIDFTIPEKALMLIFICIDLNIDDSFFLYEKAAFMFTSAEPPPPMGNRNRTIELSTVPVRDHCPSGGAAA